MFACRSLRWGVRLISGREAFCACVKIQSCNVNTSPSSVPTGRFRKESKRERETKREGERKREYKRQGKEKRQQKRINARKKERTEETC
jgi:hypothetical protein